jgi:hypothetical protein
MSDPWNSARRIATAGDKIYVHPVVNGPGVVDMWIGEWGSAGSFPFNVSPFAYQWGHNLLIRIDGVGGTPGEETSSWNYAGTLAVEVQLKLQGEVVKAASRSIVYTNVGSRDPAIPNHARGTASAQTDGIAFDANPAALAIDEVVISASGTMPHYGFSVQVVALKYGSEQSA